MQVDQITAPLSKEQAYALVDAVMERDDLALSASANEDEETGTWYFEATCGHPPDLDSFSQLARLVLGGDVDFSVEAIDPEVDWVSRSLEGLAPVRAGGFYVHGSHEEGPAPHGVTPILIDAAQAFGTGHHETTTGCLEAIDMVLKRRRPRRPIDVGTGTGVLAIGMAMRLRTAVLATDIDPIAVRTTRENAEANGVGGLVVPIEAAGLGHAAIARNAPYDLIAANILAGPLVGLAPAMGRIAAPGAAVILSGILAHQAARVINAYGRHGMALTRRLRRKDWTTLLLERR